MLSSGNTQKLKYHQQPFYPPSPPLSSTSSMSNKATLTNTLFSNNNETFLNLEKVVQTYVHHPELLELILSSKVEEDRRRAEEAKLRQKEIDYIISQQTKEKRKPSLPSLQNLTQLTSLEQQLPKIQNKNIEMLLNTPNHSSIKLPEMMTSSANSSATFTKHRRLNLSTPLHLKRPYSISNEEKTKSFILPTTSLAPPSPPSEPNHLPLSPSTTSHNKRRRREMQPITTVIETKEFPYNDDYLWKNNGNTIHKKTGFKSIYYKCSNNAKGCPANKTVTFRDNGEYLIKYRGHHFSECNRIKRITNL
ncbi:uncharacterized protein BX663DRAFT_501025 [Cokeromyces recurvatus]|uniref:uncharacterized protein n=1 Tax=Cokeromyces recurvatus TaxID=90255 RepID=UPI0022210F48|nr:uncharacterized protein BX663DRAFT_501025 [Cokeromyces recurvatus]KAI7904916.1 hypothetical protein BX663DRAFT_501025 [Cokeromyces recurvatus]